MGDSFVHFNRRDIRLKFPRDPQHPWVSELQAETAGFERPRYHVSRAVDGPAAEVEQGDTIWLVGQLYAPWRDSLPASLDARIDVSCVQPREAGPGFRYTASESSRWFPLADLTSDLQALETYTSDHVCNRLWKDHNRPVGHSLQRMRRLAADDNLRDWEMKLSSAPLHFISYRIRDGTPAAFERAKTLVADGALLFWDRWSLPRRLAERREAVGDRPLDDTIEASIREASVVWGIESPLYGIQGSYAARERALAEELGKYRAVSVNR